ncbi:MAG: hypothetical protein HC894_01750 [Microcoleus sp. SM1_3_4]|nr:hypothetical protein [Microcoleus sp. SM1_3_4]
MNQGGSQAPVMFLIAYHCAIVLFDKKIRRRQKAEGRRQKDEGRRKKEEGRKKKDEGRGMKKQEGRRMR